jgi:hypothetical protein
MSDKLDNINVVISNSDREVQDAVACAVYNTLSERGFIDVEVMRPDPANPGNSLSVHPGDEQSIFDMIQQRNPHVFAQPVRIWTHDIHRPQTSYPEYDIQKAMANDAIQREAISCIEIGIKYPFDDINPDQLDRARQAANGIIRMLSDYKGCDHAIDCIEERKELIDTMCAIINTASNATAMNAPLTGFIHNPFDRTPVELMSTVYINAPIPIPPQVDERIHELRVKYPNLQFVTPEVQQLNDDALTDFSETVKNYRSDTF